MMRIADLDGDGKMKFSEFCKLMELSSAGHREKVSKRCDNVIGAEIINMVELDNHYLKNQKV